MKQSGKFVIAAALGLGVDVFAFRTLLGAGLELSAAHIASFVLAAAASLVLIARETRPAAVGCDYCRLAHPVRG
jgi:hypothetical protein